MSTMNCLKLGAGWQELDDQAAASYSGGAATKQAPDLTLFEHRALRGKSLHVDISMPQLRRFNDLTSSFVIRRGVWVLYEKPNYKGHGFIIVPGRYTKLPPELDNQIGSIERIG